jgi:hypothetical protein
LFFLLFVFSWVIGTEGKYASFADAQENGCALSSVKCPSTTAYGRLNYDIHAMFASRRCASARVDSRDPVVDSVLIVGQAGTAAAVRESALGISPA